MIKTHKDLVVWQKSLNLVLKIYDYTNSFPKEEKFAIVDQIRRSAVSIPSNIAEGFGRYGSGEFVKFLHYAFGSLAELDTQCLISFKRKYLTDTQFDDLTVDFTEIQKMLSKLITKLKI